MSGNNTRSEELVRGGQIVQHKFTMLAQVIKTAAFFGVIVFIATVYARYMLGTDDYQRYLFGTALKTTVYFHPNPKDTMEFITPNGDKRIVRVVDVINNKRVSDNFDYVMALIESGMLIGAGLFVLLVLLLIFYFIRYGRETMRREVINGIPLEPDSRKVINLIEAMNARVGYVSRYHIGGIPFLHNTETFSIQITGAQGQGKSQTICALLDEIRANGDRAIIYDKQRSFIKYYYDEKIDRIVTPFDERSVGWNIHADAHAIHEYESIAQAMIPMQEDSNKDPYWVLGARTILAVTAAKFRHENRLKTKDLLQTLYSLSLADIAKLLKGTPAGALIDEKNPKTSESIRSVLTAYIKSMNYVFDDVPYEDLFSFKEWVSGGSGWLFLTSRGDIHTTVKPLFTAMIEVVIKACMMLDQDRNRRIFIILDEVQSLNFIPAFTDGLAELRQFGIVFVISYQLQAQLRTIYRETGATTISGLLGTRVAYQTPDEQTASWLSKNFSETEVKEMETTKSFGGSSLRDGVTVSPDTKKREVVPPSMIMNLEPHNCFVKMAGGSIPVTQLYIPYKHRDEIASPFKERDLSHLAFGHLTFIDDQSHQSTENNEHARQPKPVDVEGIVPPRAKQLPKKPQTVRRDKTEVAELQMQKPLFDPKFMSPFTEKESVSGSSDNDALTLVLTGSEAAEIIAHADGQYLEVTTLEPLHEAETVNDEVRSLDDKQTRSLSEPDLEI